MIYTEGCLPKASHWFERHILTVSICIVVLAVLQVSVVGKPSLLLEQTKASVSIQILSICFAQNLRHDILAQKAKWLWHAHPMMEYYRH